MYFFGLANKQSIWINGKFQMLRFSWYRLRKLKNNTADGWTDLSAFWFWRGW